MSAMAGFSGVDTAATLRKVRDYLKGDLAALLDCCCFHDSVTGELLPGTMDDADGEVADELRGLISECDLALNALGEA